jgi:hypothetical protein
MGRARVRRFGPAAPASVAGRAHAFVNMERLIEDFIADVERLGGGHG